MRIGLEKTFHVLTSTKNEAATTVLLAALDSVHRDVQSGALQALVRRRSANGHLELLNRWHTLGKRAKASVAEFGGRISSAVRSAILSTEEKLAENGFDAVLCLREFDLIPVLMAAARDRGHPYARQAAQTTLALVEILYEQLAGPRDYRNRRDPQLVRIRVMSSLDKVLHQFDPNTDLELAEALLLLVKADHLALRAILQDPHHRAYLPIVSLLTNSPRPGVQRLLLSYLKQVRPPATALNVISRRSDIPFVRRLLQQLSTEVPKELTANLKRIEAFSWIGDDLGMLAALNEEEQSGVVRLVMSTAMNRLKRFEVIRFVLQHGGLESRRVAAGFLAEFGGVEANEMIALCAEDPDHIVQSHAIRLLRDRGIPGALQRLIDCVDSSHEKVRHAARECLTEFTFERFLATFDMLDDEVAKSTGALVTRVDQEAIAQLSFEFDTPSRTRRLRATAMAVAMQVVPEVEDKITELLSDADHFLRAEAIRALAHSNSEKSQEAVRTCLLDGSPLVRDAAEQTLRSYSDDPPPQPPTEFGSDLDVMFPFPEAQP